MKRTLSYFLFLLIPILASASGKTNYTQSASYSPLACDIPTGLAVSDLTGTTALLSWSAVSGAIKYEIEVEDEQNTPSIFHLEASATSTNYTVTGLTPGVLYKFKVRTRCSSDKSDWSIWLFFNGNSGGSIGNNLACSRPTGVTITQITATSALVSWTAVQGAVSYSLEIERNQQGLSPWQITQVVATNSYLITGLTADTRYKVKVRTNCSNGEHSAWTKWHKFKTLVQLIGDDGTASQDRTEAVTPGAAELSLAAWPNPAQTTAFVRIELETIGEITLRLFDLSGKLVQSRIIQPESDIWEGSLPVSGLTPGLYFLQCQSGQSRQTIKLVVAQ